MLGETMLRHSSYHHSIQNGLRFNPVACRVISGGPFYVIQRYIKHRRKVELTNWHVIEPSRFCLAPHTQVASHHKQHAVASARWSALACSPRRSARSFISPWCGAGARTVAWRRCPHHGIGAVPVPWSRNGAVACR